MKAVSNERECCSTEYHRITPVMTFVTTALLLASHCSTGVCIRFLGEDFMRNAEQQGGRGGKGSMFEKESEVYVFVARMSIESVIASPEWEFVPASAPRRSHRGKLT